MKPDQSLFKTHLGEAPFLAGVDAGRWALCGSLDEILWPNPIFWVAASKRIAPAAKIHLRFTADNYPSVAPTSCPWNIETNARLEDAAYPKVPGKFARVFRTDWKGGTALYAPCDRVPMSDHPNWKDQFPYWWWRPEFTIVKYLAFVHLVLNPIDHDSDPN